MTSPPDPAASFPLTRWSLVVSSREADGAGLAELCRLYWQPLYVFCRRSGLNIEDAEDVTQRFFHDLIQARTAFLASASPNSGRLRTLFLRVLQRRIADHHRHANRAKRGGGQVISLDTAAAEASLQAVSPDATAGEVFDRQWALRVLQLALTRLEEDFSSVGRSHHFTALAPFLGLGSSDGNYDELRQTLQLNDARARQAVHRFRERFRSQLRAEIAETIADTDEAAIDHELAELRQALRSCSR